MSHLDDVLTQKANLKFVSKAMKQPLLSLADEKKITKLWAKKKDVQSFKENILSNSFFGATKYNAILKRMLNKKVLNSIDYYDMHVDFQTGPGFLRKHIFKNDNIHIFPTMYFYPFVEEYSPEQKDPPYRKHSTNKCHSKKYKKGYTKLNNNKGYIKFPCTSYKNSYALKHWQLGKSWLISNYFTISTD